ASGEFNGNYTLHGAIVDQQPGDQELVVAGYGTVSERCLKQGVQQVKAGLVSREPRSCFLHPAEGANSNVPIRLATPGTAPMLQTQQLLRGLSHEDFHRVLIAEPIAAGDGIVSMFIQAV